MDTNVLRSNKSHESLAYNALKIGFIVAPIVAGLDKFFNALTDWTQYLAPVFPDILNISPSTFMMVVGIIEIVAGIGVIFKPKIFAHVVSAWLLGIIVNLLILGAHYDIALRDLGLSIGAFALGQLAYQYERKHLHAEEFTGRDNYKNRMEDETLSAH